MLTFALFLGGIARITLIMDDEKIKVSAQQNVKVITLSNLRGNIFDTNGVSLTGDKEKIYAVITPTPTAVMYASNVLYGDEKIEVLAKLRNQKVAIIETEKEINCAGIITVKGSAYTTESGFCSHLLGYLNNENQGVSGIQKAYDSILYSDKKLTVKLFTSGTGEMLSGIEPEISEHKEVQYNGVILTIDKKVQETLERVSVNLEKGAVLISEAGSGKIRGMVSRPNFDANNLKDSLEDDDAPFLNRCLMSFNVGSVFKPLVSVSYLEGQKMKGFSINCTGTTLIGDKEFACHKRDGHGRVNLYDALAFSCNSFFYSLAPLITADNIVKTASVFGIGYKKELCKGIETANEKMPDTKELESSLALANLSIGQGSLMASPVTLLSLYEAIACEGVYHKPTVVEGIIKNGITEYEREPSKIKAMSKETADIIKNALRKVVQEGTAQNVLLGVDGAGKTSTAQTGQKDGGREVEHSWFCGFFPFDNPEYVVTVLVEDSFGKEKQAMEIFKELSLRLLNR